MWTIEETYVELFEWNGHLKESSLRSGEMQF